MIEFSILEQLSNTPGKNDKIQVLKDFGTPRLRTLLCLAYNRFWTYRVKQLDRPSRYNTVQPDILEELEELLMMLAQHTTGTVHAKGMIKTLLAKCTEANALWVERIILRDLNIGIDEKTINKALPGCVPVFDCQLAYPIYAKGKKVVNRWPSLNYPVIVEEKLDGVRVIAVVKDGGVTFYSREGHDDEYDEKGVIAGEILRLRPGTDFVLDGEMIAKKFYPDHKVALKHKDANRWPFELAKSLLKNGSTTKDEVREYVGYYVWDLIELDYFESQGGVGKLLPLTERKFQLTAAFSRQHAYAFKNLFLVPNTLAFSEQAVKREFQLFRNQGGEIKSCLNSKGQEITYTVPRGEGAMVKGLERGYEFSRTDAVLKVKEFFSMDLRIIDAYEGEPDTKYSGMLGGFVLASDCGTIKTKCGGLRGDEGQRFELWMLHKRGMLIGGIVEVDYQEVTADGSLTFPIGQLRYDKTTTSLG